MRHLLCIEFRPHNVAHKQQLGTGVVDDVVNLLRQELMQDRHRHSAVCQGGQEGYSPACAVAAADGDFVSVLHAGGFENDVEFLDDTCYVLVVERLNAIVAEGIQLPVLFQAFQNTGVETWDLSIHFLDLVSCSG